MGETPVQGDDLKGRHLCAIIPTLFEELTEIISAVQFMPSMRSRPVCGFPSPDSLHASSLQL
jgi:hypothetical protein